MNIPLVTVFIFAAMVATFSLSQVYAEPVIYDDDYIVEKFVSRLGFPTTMTFVGDEILILEKSSGNVIRIQDNGVPYPNLYCMFQWRLKLKVVCWESLRYLIMFFYIIRNQYLVMARATTNFHSVTTLRGMLFINTIGMERS